MHFQHADWQFRLASKSLNSLLYRSLVRKGIEGVLDKELLEFLLLSVALLTCLKVYLLCVAPSK